MHTVQSIYLEEEGEGVCSKHAHHSLELVLREPRGILQALHKVMLRLNNALQEGDVAYKVSHPHLLALCLAW
jgi:hypothetical protein